jgi:hypothetical protein
VENSDSSALAPTRDYPRILFADILTIWIVRIFSRIRISRILSADSIRIPVSVVNTAQAFIFHLIFGPLQIDFFF